MGPSVAHLYVRTGDGEPEMLAEGTTGSLTWCGDSLWFVQQVEGRLLRWHPESGLEVAFRDPDDHEVGVLSAPLCAGDSVSIAVMSGRAGQPNKETLHVTSLE